MNNIKLTGTIVGKLKTTKMKMNEDVVTHFSVETENWLKIEENKWKK